MGKKYEVKDINKNGKIDSWEQAKYDAINESQGAANVGKLLQSQPGSMGLMNPNQSMGKVEGMIRQQPREPMGMDVSTNAQILNDAYNFNNLGMAKIGKIQEARNKGYKGMDLQGALSYLDNRPVNKITPKGIDTSNKGPAQVNKVKPTKDNKYGRNPDDYHPDANLNDKYPRRKENDPRSKTFQKNLKNK